MWAGLGVAEKGQKGAKKGANPNPARLPAKANCFPTGRSPLSISPLAPICFIWRVKSAYCFHFLHSSVMNNGVTQKAK